MEGGLRLGLSVETAGHPQPQEAMLPSWGAVGEKESWTQRSHCGGPRLVEGFALGVVSESGHCKVSCRGWPDSGEERGPRPSLGRGGWDVGLSGDLVERVVSEPGM